MLYIVRHGETVFNRENRYQGVSDSPLTETGKKQAQAIALYLKNCVEQPTFYISPLPRVQETYVIISSKVAGPCTVFPLLSEISYGEWEGKRKEELLHMPQWEERKRNRYTFIIAGSYKGHPGESYQMLYDRLIPFWKERERQLHKDIIVIAHLGVLLVAKKYFQKLSDSEIAGYKPRNDVIQAVSKKDGTVLLSEINTL